MLHHQILVVLGLLFVILGLQMVSRKLKVPFPILLVLGGLAFSELPFVPHIMLEPEWVFLLFLPPLLYEAAWYTSWRDFWRLRAPITVQAFGLVFFTSIVVAYFAQAFIPGFTLALGFLLGGIISPPDAITAATVLDEIEAPKDAVAIIEGESLINDSSSLIVYQFALTAVLTQMFDPPEAFKELLWVSLAGLGMGIALAQGLYLMRKRLPTTPSIDTSLTLMSPYLFYIAAESVEASGVLSVVAGGLFLSYRGHEFLSSRSHVQSGSMWSTLSFLLNSFVFLLIGLQLPVVVESLEATHPLGQATMYGVAVTGLAIAVRIIWVFPTAFLIRLWPSMRKDPTDWKTEMLVAWAGMRGVVSLASAMALPLLISEGTPFPNRDLILYITFCVILLTLILQGLSLPALIRWLNFPPDHLLGTPEQQRHSMNMRLALAAREHLAVKYAEECATVPMFGRLLMTYEWIVSHAFVAGGNSAESERERAQSLRYREVLLEIIEVQRQEIVQARREGSYDHEITVEREDELNLEAARLERSVEEGDLDVGTPGY